MQRVNRRREWGSVQRTLSAEPEARSVPSAEKSSDQMVFSWWPDSTLTRLPVPRSQIITVLSSPFVGKRGHVSAVCVLCACVPCVCRVCAVCVSGVKVPAEASRRPSGEKARA
jgi:hypothetical protein